MRITNISPRYFRLILFVFVLGSGSGILHAQPMEYVCLPCGYDCDGSNYAKGGVCGSCGMELVDRQSITFKNIDFNELCSRLKANPGIQLLDVRSAEEFANTSSTVESFGRFKNALNINVVDLQKRIGELEKFKNQEVIVYCSHSHRSPRASYYLSTHGFKNVTNVSGGVSLLSGNTLPGCLKEEFIEFPSRR